MGIWTHLRAEDSAARPGSERSGRVRVTLTLRFGCNLIGFGLLTERLVGWLLLGAGGREQDSVCPGWCCSWRSVAVGRFPWRAERSLQGPAAAALCSFVRFSSRLDSITHVTHGINWLTLRYRGVGCVFCPAGVTWSPGGETGPMAQRVRKNQLLLERRDTMSVRGRFVFRFHFSCTSLMFRAENQQWTTFLPTDAKRRGNRI